MATLYEVLNEITGDDITQKFSPQEIQKISQDMEKRIKKKIGSKKYKKLEKYVIKNKDDKDLKDLTKEILSNLAWQNLKLAAGELSASNQEIVLGYKLTDKLYEVLEASKYDAGQAILDMYCK